MSHLCSGFVTLTMLVVAGSSFACAMHLDVTLKRPGRMTVNELCIYEVKDGKIISEQFTSRFHV